ncbi:hypothetical protein B0H11DRAFT_225736 [Mycena galericulata]|nr:hypothetical protein B0H11DRAFT_225736 [Mycena galericulata]
MANYLLKTVRADTPTFAVLDLQARTRTSNCVCARAGREGEYKYELGLEFGGRRACSVLYQHSYLGYGGWWARCARCMRGGAGEQRVSCMRDAPAQCVCAARGACARPCTIEADVVVRSAMRAPSRDTAPGAWWAGTWAGSTRTCAQLVMLALMLASVCVWGRVPACAGRARRSRRVPLSRGGRAATTTVDTYDCGVGSWLARCARGGMSGCSDGGTRTQTKTTLMARLEWS